MDTSSNALRIPRFDAKRRYTVAGGTPESALIAFMVVAA
jgi:hypothetical protein